MPGARRAEHANLIAHALVRGIHRIKDGKLNGDAKAALRTIVETARRYFAEASGNPAQQTENAECHICR
jgi:hypothetical protein